MKFHWNNRDGGPASTVMMYGLEIKSLCSLLVLRFDGKSREAYHTHAFKAWSWLLRGTLIETIHKASQDKPTWYEWTMEHFGIPRIAYITRFWFSGRAIVTPRERFHKVDSLGVSWVLSFRGPWERTWREYLPAEDRFVLLANGREVVD